MFGFLRNLFGSKESPENTTPTPPASEVAAPEGMPSMSAAEAIAIAQYHAIKLNIQEELTWSEARCKYYADGLPEAGRDHEDKPVWVVIATHPENKFGKSEFDFFVSIEIRRVVNVMAM